MRKKNKVATLMGQYSKPEDFGEALANALEHRPELALPTVNSRLSAYQFLAHLGNIVREFRIDFVIDAGAHSGQFASTLFGYGQYKGVIHSYEPVLRYYETMKVHESYWPGWKVFNMGLGDVSGQFEINVGPGHGGTSSILPQSDHFKNYVPDEQLTSTETIEVRRVDEIYEKELHDPSRRVMLKLDVQGFEDRVLASCGTGLQNLKLVLVEMSSTPLYEGQKTFGEMCSLLESAGFSVIYVSNNFGIKSSIFLDFDCVFCRTDELHAMRA